MRPSRLAGCLLPLSLAACANSLAGQPGLQPVVQQYYERRATEENGRCRAPLMEGVLNSTLVESNPQHIVVHLRYLYRDLTAELRGACRGFGNRTFTLATEGSGFTVVEMSGGQHPAGLRLRLAS